LIRVAKDLVAREDYTAAWNVCNEVLNAHPDRPEALFLMGYTLRELGKVGLAYQCLRRALSDETARKQINVWMAYGACLHHLCRYEEAIESYTTAHHLMPKIPEPIASISAGYVQLGKAREANEWADKALKISNENHVARISKAFACLCLGRWGEAWEHKEYLYGPQLEVRLYHKPGSPAETAWDGTKGQTVVVQCDQGLGDQIMFSQCLPRLIEDCKQVIIECSKRMESFFKHNFPKAHVYGTLKDSGLQWPLEYDIDAHTHISFLGKWYLKGDYEFTRSKYITPDPKKLDKWVTWLSQFPKPWVGLSWKGGIANTQKEWRSVALADLAPVMRGTLIDMSYMDNGLEIARWNIDHENQVITPPIDTADYQDTISLVAALDDVVTVTTTLAHVCGALGRHAYVLVPSVAQWRYAYRHEDGTEMIWYPSGSVRLYRQNHGEPWAHAINRLAKDFNSINMLRAA
jgi:tetratricopeptide (TPR) repeat protein